MNPLLAPARACLFAVVVTGALGFAACTHSPSSAPASAPGRSPASGVTAASPSPGALLAPADPQLPALRGWTAVREDLSRAAPRPSAPAIPATASDPLSAWVELVAALVAPPAPPPAPASAGDLIDDALAAADASLAAAEAFSSGHDRATRFEALVGEFPSGGDWAAAGKALAARLAATATRTPAAAALHAWAATLAGDEAAQRAALTRVQAQLAKPPAKRSRGLFGFLSGDADADDYAVTARRHAQQELAFALARQLDDVPAQAAAVIARLRDAGDDDYLSLSLPGVVERLGPAEAERLVRPTLPKIAARLHQIEGRATRAAIYEWIRADAATWPALPWELVRDPALARELYPALAAADRAKGRTPPHAATWHHLVARVETGETTSVWPDLLALARPAPEASPQPDGELDSSDSVVFGHDESTASLHALQPAITEAGTGEAWLTWLLSSAAAPLGSDRWALTLPLAVQHDRGADWRAAVPPEDLPGLGPLWKTHLALGDTTAALAALRAQPDAMGWKQFGEAAFALDRSDWREETVAQLDALPVAPPQDRWGGDTAVPDRAALLARLGRPDRAEALLTTALRQLRNAPPQPSHFGPSSAATDPLLAALARLYATHGRPADAIAVLRQGEWSQSTNLAEAARLGEGYGSAPLGPVLARALAATGETAPAEALLQTVLWDNPAHDPAYAAWLDLKGPAAGPWLAHLAATHPFEDRPLIWQATLALREGDAPAAERLARAAIALDPSDGGQPAGDRMRAYAVLAEALAARGDATQATFYRGVVAAIRQAERADVLHAAGLWSEALPLYRTALEQFADAYCVQSRLAVQLAEAGRLTEAEVHYQRAFELMPDSFGRVESHCFGCEQVFASALAQNVAERVFMKLRAARPEQPQIHYLLGYLREEQGWIEEAAAGYREAVRLDPAYLNAWSRLQNLAPELGLPAAERRTILLALARLDPIAAAGCGNLFDSGDWPAILAAAQPPPAPDETALQAWKLGRKPAGPDEGASSFAYSPTFHRFGRDLSTALLWSDLTRAVVDTLRW